MFSRAVDSKRAATSARSHGVVVIEALLPLGLLEQRLMCDRRAPADVADMDRAWLIERYRRKTWHINSKRQVGARSANDARYLLDAVTVPDEDMVKGRQELEQIFRQQIRPDLGDEASRLA